MVDASGRVVGVAVATYKDGQNLNFAVPVEYLRRLRDLAKPQPVRLLSEAGSVRLPRSVDILDGPRDTLGIVGDKFRWEAPYYNGIFSFSIENRLSFPVKNVSLIAIFIGPDGSPIDAKDIFIDDIIPAGLARRVRSAVDGSTAEIAKGWNNPNDFVAGAKIEFRVLDFDTLQ